jgi:hypothetical protein
MHLGSVTRVEVNNRSDLDSHADCFVCGKEAHIFDDFDREVTVTGWDPEGVTKLMRIVSDELGYTIQETWNTVILIFHQIIFSPSLNHNFLSTMQVILHDVVVNETPKIKCLEPTSFDYYFGIE